MAEKIKVKAARPRGSALNLPMAALAAGSVGFFASAMPADLFESLVAATGLPALLPTAQPPLGATARIAVVAVAALATFGAVWLLLRALDRKPAPAPTVAPFAETVAEEPSSRRRRAIIQPDEPADAEPGFSRDFGVPLDAAPADRGEPVDVSEIEDVDYEAEWERPAPSFLSAPVDGPGPEAEPAAVESQPEAAEDVPEVPFWLPNGVDSGAQDEPEAEMQAETPVTDGADPVILPFWAQQAEAEVQEEQVQPADPSLDQLATRLEGGLIRRKREGRSTRPRGHRGTDDRLRTALDDLTKMTKRS